MSKAAITPGATDWIGLAAAPTFALMALLTASPGVGPDGMVCSAGHSGFLLSGMVPMYLLMSAFHTAPWLKMVSSLAHPPPRLSGTE